MNYLNYLEIQNIFLTLLKHLNGAIERAVSGIGPDLVLEKFDFGYLLLNAGVAKL